MQLKGSQQQVQTKQMCISAMKEYEAKSLEEIRCNDYIGGRKVNTSGAPTNFAQPQGSGLFSKPGGGLFSTGFSFKFFKILLIPPFFSYNYDTNYFKFFIWHSTTSYLINFIWSKTRRFFIWNKSYYTTWQSFWKSTFYWIWIGCWWWYFGSE